MRSFKFLAVGASALALMIGATAAQASTSIGNTPTGGSISPFGYSDTQTYGQVFTAPVSGKLSSFTLYLNGAIGGQLYGGIGEWNGASSYGGGYGVSSVDYTSANVNADHSGAYTFSPNLNVIGGKLYVAYLSVYGLDHTGQHTTSMPLGTGASSLNYFVWNNGSSPSSSSWNYFFNAGNAQFNASFDAGGVPEPAAWALMIGGFGFAGASLRRRRAATAA